MNSKSTRKTQPQAANTNADLLPADLRAMIVNLAALEGVSPAQYLRDAVRLAGASTLEEAKHTLEEAAA